MSLQFLKAFKKQLHDIKDIIVYTWESNKSPIGEKCQMEIVVENNYGMESGHQPGKSDSVTTHTRYVK